MKKLLAIAALGLPLMASAQVNAGFETGNFNGWTVNQGGATELATVINYGNTVYGEAINPGAAGSFGVYFVEDSQAQSVSQTTVSAAGLYNWSVQYYLPANGFANPFDATITLSLGGSNVVSSALSTMGPAQQWFTLSGQAALPANYSIVLSFDANGHTGKDIIIDNVTVTAVPEPESFALMVAGLAAVGFLARRRRA